MVTILTGDCLDVLPTLPERSVRCCVTSPPYYGLRDYGTASWTGGDAICDHVQLDMHVAGMDGTTQNSARQGRTPPPNILYKSRCGKCGATRTDSQIGLEATPDAYVAQLVAVFRAVRRVLTDDGTLWLNIGDSYFSTTRGSGGSDPTTSPKQAWKGAENGQAFPSRHISAGHLPLKAKDLIGIPWRVAFALQADGWYLRSDIIWHKPNPMPESVTDRPTKAHEYVFLLSKQPTYYYDADAVKEPLAVANAQRTTARYDTAERYGAGNGGNGGLDDLASRMRSGAHTARNRRSVWTIATQPYKGAHFATFPPALITPCILAGTSQYGGCATCGSPWTRRVERVSPPQYTGGKAALLRETGSANHRTASGPTGNGLGVQPSTTTGWTTSCDCDAGVVPDTVLDPFGGAGTTGVVASGNGRNAVLIELNPQYAEMARARIGLEAA